MQCVKNTSTSNSMSFHSLGSNMVYQHISFVIGAPLKKVPIHFEALLASEKVAVKSPTRT